MELHELTFAKIIILRDDIAEVIINDGIDMDMPMLEVYHNFLLSNLKAPFSLLINKINSYSYNADVLLNLAELSEINVMAIVSYKRITTVSTEYLHSIPRPIEWNLKIFSNRDDALTWLESEQDNLLLSSDS